jgi:hypothetical protein
MVFTIMPSEHNETSERRCGMSSPIHSGQDWLQQLPTIPIGIAAIFEFLG